MYFPHAFRKDFFVQSSVASVMNSLLSGTATTALTAGQIGFFKSTSATGSNSTLVSTSSAATTPFIIAQGSYFNSDKISPALGGYKESIKSKLINPKYISRVMTVAAKAPRQMVVNVPVTCGLACDTTYRLRVDVKGSPALRFLSHNMYRVLDSYTGCCNTTDPTLQKDPIVTLLNWKDQINNSPIFNTMVDARVYAKAGTTVAGTWANVSTGLSAQTLTFAVGNTTGVAIGQKVVATNLPANSFVTALAATATATHSATGVTITTSTYTATTGGTTLNGAVTVGSSVSGAGFPVGSYISAYTGTAAFVITFPTQAVAPTISGTITVSASATVTYPTQQTAPTSIATTGIKVYNDLYTGVAGTPLAASATVIPGTETQTGVGGSAVISLGTVTNATIGASSTVLASVGGAHVYNAGTGEAISYSVDAHIELTGAYVETKFGTCTFTPTDKYDLEPLLMYTAIVDETGDPCSSFCFTTSNTPDSSGLVPNNQGIVQLPIQASGVGETLLRTMILSNRYMQNAYPDSNRVESLRMREIEQDPALAIIDRNALYDQVMVLHSVPRFNNPTGTFDNDQYLLVINVPTGTTTTAFTNFLVGSANAAQGTSAVVLEAY